MISTICIFLASMTAILALLRKCSEWSWGSYNCDVNLQDRVFIVTGANSGIGKEVARELAKRKATVIFACRNTENAIRAIADIRRSTNFGKLVQMELDLASFDSIKDFAKRVTLDFPEIHVLINNAGVYVPLKDQQNCTKEGFEAHFGVNHLGHFLLTNLLLENLEKSAPSRVVVVTSKLMESGSIDFSNLNAEKKMTTKTRMNPCYCNSKLANTYFAMELAKRVKGIGINVYAVCPGFTYTGLFKHVKRQWFHYVIFSPIALLFLRTARQGAMTVLKCAIDPTLENESGKLYRNCKTFVPKKTLDPDIASRLWDVSAEMTGIR